MQMWLYLHCLPLSLMRYEIERNTFKAKQNVFPLAGRGGRGVRAHGSSRLLYRGDNARRQCAGELLLTGF